MTDAWDSSGAQTDDGFALSTSTGDGAVVIRLAGELDMAAVPHFDAVLAQVLQDTANTKIYIDFTEVTLVDSTAIGALIRGRTTALEQGRPFVVTNPQGMVHRVLQVAGVLDTLTGDNAE